MKLSSFNNFINEAKENSFQERIQPGDLVVTMFFDHTKNQYNEHVLWNNIIDIINTHCNFEEYCVTDSVCEFIASSCDESKVASIRKEVEKFKSSFTNFDVYIVSA
jgi:hypothetical protein